MPTKASIKIAQLGCGYWGPNLTRCFNTSDRCTLSDLVEPDPKRRQFVAKNFPNVSLHESPQPVLEDKSVQAIIVSTPVSTHYKLVKDALNAGKHVFVEKPLASSYNEARELADLAAAKSLILMVGHTFVYNDAVRYLKKLLEQGELGEVFYTYNQRLNLGQVRKDVNVWWNLAPHDISILLFLFPDILPTSGTASGRDVLQTGLEDVVFANLQWNSQLSTHLHMSWLDPNKVRRMTIVGQKKMVIYDDMAQDKIAIIDKGYETVPTIGSEMHFDTPGQTLVQRHGDITLPHIQYREPLKNERDHFLDCIETGDTPISGGENGCQVVRILEDVQTQLDKNKKS
ncbi:Gfo/Idh/MocA family protein [Pelagicoccus mobilis]|uniref:Gfo/Idh/MocA family oxidoreductase n=1 Tax=Pelagicoccus mobilis TaxID=415221 RepID=A0A934RZ67_9BACT|nr:Gfo/Idh/MocA family oxidoreductase [Pelagicoccus mobilis]MBK1878220.1 Gfo/Idh/MocA family oxidoreductase [Pelagicoccus mobilis]